MANNETERGVSVLICTYNGASRLEPTLQALLNQEKAGNIPWEVVLVDNASSDRTAETAQKIWGNAGIPFRIISEPNPGRDNALRTGFKNVQYEFVCNVDDDTWVCRDYVSLVWEIMNQHPEVAVCGGYGIGEFEVTPPAWLKQFETALAIGAQADQTGYMTSDRNYLYGACAVYRKSLWDKLLEINFQFFLSGRKGKQLNSGEDFELCQAWKMLGYKLYYDNRISFRHYMPEGRLTWSYFRKLYKAFGRSDLVTQQYFAAQGIIPPHRLRIFRSYSLYLLYNFYQLIKYLPGYLLALAFRNEGNEDILLFERYTALIGELIRNKKRYRAVKEALSENKWKEQSKKD
ncbi:MAG: glycosyltransferase family 2 protein [Bacteroidales bacterium]|nr:glycosyltransferase family 2 protein [Bacteroidales bacterium]